MGKPLITEALRRVPVPENGCYLDGSDYLQSVSGDDGEQMQLMAIGYSMAAHDAARTAAYSSDAVPAGTSPRTLGDQIGRACARLRAMPSLRGRCAFDLLSGGSDAPPSGHAASTTTRHGFATAILAACVGAILLSGIVATTHRLRDSAHEATAIEIKEKIALSEQAFRILSLVLEERRYEKDSFISIPDADRVAAYAEKWEASRQALDDAIAGLRKHHLDEADRQFLADMERDFRAYADGYGQVLAKVKTGQIRSTQEANSSVERFKTSAHRIEQIAAAIATRAAALARADT